VSLEPGWYGGEDVLGTIAQQRSSYWLGRESLLSSICMTGVSSTSRVVVPKLTISICLCSLDRCSHGSGAHIYALSSFSMIVQYDSFGDEQSLEQILRGCRRQHRLYAQSERSRTARGYDCGWYSSSMESRLGHASSSSTMCCKALAAFV